MSQIAIRAFEILTVQKGIFNVQSVKNCHTRAGLATLAALHSVKSNTAARRSDLYSTHKNWKQFWNAVWLYQRPPISYPMQKTNLASPKSRQPLHPALGNRDPTLHFGWNNCVASINTFILRRTAAYISIFNVWRLFNSFLFTGFLCPWVRGCCSIHMKRQPKGRRVVSSFLAL